MIDNIKNAFIVNFFNDIPDYSEIIYRQANLHSSNPIYTGK